MSRHILDRAVWSALSTRQKEYAIGGARARRFAPDIGPLAASRDDSAESLAELAELIPVEGALILLQADPIVLPPGVEAVTTAAGVQMVAERVTSEGRGGRRLDAQIEKLGADDIPEMVALATLTKPGPFDSGTSKLGTFWGIKENGVLLGMAGERMCQEGFAEVSAVCTHPDVRGRGFARALSASVAQRILDRGETPYLHAYSVNEAAIGLYQSLGFRIRSEVHVAFIARKA